MSPHLGPHMLGPRPSDMRDAGISQSFVSLLEQNKQELPSPQVT